MNFFKRTEWLVLVRVLGLFVTITLTSLIILKGWYIYLVIAIPVIIAQLVDIFKLIRKAHEELGMFVESVHYRDFSRQFDVKHAPADLQPLRQGFNEINSTIKDITRERETQYQYLQKILELIDTGILMYREDEGTVVWMNDALKRMLQLPYLKTINSLGRRDAELHKQVVSLKPGETRIGTAHLEKTPFKVLLSATAFFTDNVKYKLIAFQNVNEALDETESKAWQKLLSVMTHEIMNSIAPVSSLAATLKRRLQESARELGQGSAVVEDLELGIDTIKRRSEGLLKFAETYRNLNKITTPNLRKVYVRDLFENLHHLMLPTLLAKKIEVEVILKDPDLMLDADTNLVEQVLINLLVNSIEAVKDQPQPHIILSAYLASNRRTVIRISDNGTGMSEEVLEKIFIPFFSTKKSGSGIGLSLCKQIMMLHRGHIQVQSVEGEGTAFILQF